MWTDTIQAVIILLGMLLVCIMGSIKVGGVLYVYNTAKEIGRLNFDKLVFCHFHIGYSRVVVVITSAVCLHENVLTCNEVLCLHDHV